MSESDQVRKSVAWVYAGIWGVLARWFRVPAGPPSLPAFGKAAPISMRPANGFLSYQRFLFAVSILAPVLATAVAIAAINLALPVFGIVLSAPILLGVGLFVAVGWTAIHLRFDTQWYVLTDRSVRIRRGIWVIEESTITFENVQDITVLQGPLQRYFGISDVIVETAGGGGASSSHGKGEQVNRHTGIIQGITEPSSLKDMISARVRASRSAGLGDDHAHAGAMLGAPHVALLREIVAELRATAAGRG